jgi:hypothetical protein
MQREDFSRETFQEGVFHNSKKNHYKLNKKKSQNLMI